jgi:Uma2 family endonuclease
MAAHPHPRLTPDQYLELERTAPYKSEYFDGIMYAMPGVSWQHALITANLARELGNRLKGTSCAAVTSDMRVRIGIGGLFAYPDIVVVCDQPGFTDAHVDTLLNPQLLVEVLSPSTEAYDRGFKSQQYRTLESLQEYALASQTEPRIEVFRRHSGTQWVLTEFAGLESACRLDSLNVSIPLADIYDKVVFQGEPPLVPPASMPA